MSEKIGKLCQKALTWVDEFEEYKIKRNKKIADEGLELNVHEDGVTLWPWDVDPSLANTEKGRVFQLMDDELFSEEFREGYAYQEELLDKGLIKEIYPVSTKWEQEDTDWDEEAMEDEDELENARAQTKQEASA